mmetsp:Transcript_12223/g.17374  ORF Transcript_12223/g.17374 Transcript_12223/m.17374 type:complete len:265 (+) Transcript_12223:943-1737(+)
MFSEFSSCLGSNGFHHWNNGHVVLVGVITEQCISGVGVVLVPCCSCNCSCDIHILMFGCKFGDMFKLSICDGGFGHVEGLSFPGSNGVIVFGNFGNDVFHVRLFECSESSFFPFSGIPFFSVSGTVLIFVNLSVIDIFETFVAKEIGPLIFGGCIVKSRRCRFVKGNFDAKINLPLLSFSGSGRSSHRSCQQSRLLQFSPFLQICQTFGLLQHLFAGLTLGLLALRVGQTRAGFLKHFNLIFVHIDRIWSCRFCFGMRINISRS